jgi:hypothetical protein
MKTMEEWNNGTMEKTGILDGNKRECWNNGKMESWVKQRLNAKI